MELANTTHDPSFLRARRWSLGAVMFCYLFYYTGRQTFGFSIPGIQAELGVDNQALGWISAAMLWASAAGQKKASKKRLSRHLRRVQRRFSSYDQKMTQ